MDLDDLVTVYTLGNPMKAEIIKNFLEIEGIHCFLEGINQAAEPGLLALEIKIQVPALDAERARELIEAQEAQKVEEA